MKYYVNYWSDIESTHFPSAVQNILSVRLSFPSSTLSGVDLILGNRKRNRVVLNHENMEGVQRLWNFYWPKIALVQDPPILHNARPFFLTRSLNVSKIF